MTFGRGRGRGRPQSQQHPYSQNPNNQHTRKRSHYNASSDGQTNGSFNQQRNEFEGSMDSLGKKPKHSNLYVWQIPRQMNEEQLTEIFQECGQVESCTIMRDVHTKQSKGYGFVKFSTFEDACEAKERLHGRLVDNNKQLMIKHAYTDSNGVMGEQHERVIGLMGGNTDGGENGGGGDASFLLANPCDNVYVKGLPLDTEEHELREIFGQFGTIVSCRVIATTGLVKFETVEEATEAVREGHGKLLVKGGSVPVSVTFNAKQQMLQSQSNLTHSNLYVWNIPKDLSEDNLKEIFSAHGVVESVTIMRDKTSQVSKGYGFVKFTTYADAENAIHIFHGKILRDDLQHKPLQVKFANTDSGSAPGAGSSMLADTNFAGNDSSNPPSENIYIKGLPAETTEDELVNAFSMFGKIASCKRIATTGIIGFQSIDDAARAVAGANGKNLFGGSGVPLSVTFKSQICRTFAQTGRCSFGWRCKFGHGQR
jgi:polyadenylate-binding protein